MVAAELRGGDRPSLNEALGWIGLRVDDVYGATIGRLEDVWIDPGTGAPRWLLVKEGRFGGRTTLVPFDEATASGDRVWIPYEREVVREAPQIEPGAPLTQQVEVTLRNHYAANATAAVSHGARSPAGERSEPSGEGRAAGATIRLASPDPAVEREPVPPPRMPERPAPPVGSEARPAQPHQPGYEHAAGAPPAQPAQPGPAPGPYFAQPSPAPPSQPPPAPAADPLALLRDLPPGYRIEIELGGDVTISGELSRVRIVPPGDPGYGG